MKKIVIYKTPHCPYCINAVSLLERKNIPFETVDLSQDPELMAKIMGQTGMRTVPQIFIGDHFVGGFDQLNALSDEDLNSLLGM